MLLEVLIAFIIALMALAVLYGGANNGLLGSRQAARTEEAIARARSRLVAICQGARLIAEEQSGDDGSGYTWRSRISRTGSEPVKRKDTGQADTSMRADLFSVRVTVSWSSVARPREVSLETLCLTTSPADRP